MINFAYLNVKYKGYKTEREKKMSAGIAMPVGGYCIPYD